MYKATVTYGVCIVFGFLCSLIISKNYIVWIDYNNNDGTTQSNG